jgi:deoxyhypusine synthase
MGPTSTETAVPSSVAAAVLKPSHEMPEGSQKVEELDFNAFAGRPITVEDLISGTNHMGFQASSIGEAVRIINRMVCTPYPNCVKLLVLILARFVRWILQATNNGVERVARPRDW